MVRKQQTGSAAKRSATAGSIRKRPTMKDVALHAQVSVSTVSYVLNDSGPVAPERRERVLAAVRALDYTPNESARRLKRQASATIGFVVPDLTNQYFALVAEGVEHAASEADVLVVLCAPEVAGATSSRHVRLLRSQRLDGVIYLTGASASPATLFDLIKLGPVVLVDEQIPGFDLPAVVCDGRRGAREIARHVLERGHRRLTIIGGPANLWTSEQRNSGYREALAAAGMDPDATPIFDGDYREQSGYELGRQALAGAADRRPTALLCANDLMAIGALRYCRTVGLDVPSDVSIVGFDDVPVATLLTPQLTTVRQPAREMGFRSATLLFELLDDVDTRRDENVFPVELMLRESVATIRS